MKNPARKTLLCLAAICALGTATAWADTNPKPFVIPELKTWNGAEGRTALSLRIIPRDKAAETVAQQLVNDYRLLFGQQLTIAKGTPRQGDIVLSCKGDKALGNEGYKLDIGNQVTLSAPTAKGLFWATRTLLQVRERQADGTLPRGTATDTPEYKLRGLMIDCGRKFIPLTYLRDLTRIMAYYKMNTLQVHLNDNGFRQYFGGDWNKTQAAFRLECDTYPGLTAKDGSYTKQEFIDLQKLAEKQYIELIPEIDAPAHALSITQYRPELGSKDYGMDHLDLFNPDTYTFMDGLWKEYIGGKQPVFRGKRVHIGTDEYSNARKDVVEKFREFTDHYIRLVESYGKKAMLWGALTHAKGDTPVKSKDVTMQIWYNGYANPDDMKQQGYNLVSIPDGWVYIVPAAGYYYDYLDCKELYKSWTPAVVGERKYEENDPAIEGGMFAVWNDHPGNGITVHDIHDRLYPALQTLATKCWAGKHTGMPYDEYDSLRTTLSEAPGVNELARHGKPGDTVIEKATLTPGETLRTSSIDRQGDDEMGYGYSVTFTVDGTEEAKGTELLRSNNAVFYLADPQQGKLGFEREGYLDTFNYRIAKGERHTLTIEGTNRSTRLLVDGKLREELSPITLCALQEKDRFHRQVDGAYTQEPLVYAPTARMHYQRTLYFPLGKAGQFKSKVTDLKVTHLKNDKK